MRGRGKNHISTNFRAVMRSLMAVSVALLCLLTQMTALKKCEEISACTHFSQQQKEKHGAHLTKANHPCDKQTERDCLLKSQHKSWIHSACFFCFISGSVFNHLSQRIFFCLQPPSKYSSIKPLATLQQNVFITVSPLLLAPKSSPPA